MKTLTIAAGVGVAAYLLTKPILSFLRRKTATVRLQYFNIKGLGEPIRLILSLSGVPFEDYRFADRDEFLALKPKLKFGQVPCLTVNGTELFQSAAIFRFVATYFGATDLYPSDALLAAQVDALLDQVKDMDIGKGVASYKRRFGFPESVLNDDNAEQVFELWRAETLPRHLSFFEAALDASPTAWLCGTASPTIADVFLATQLNSYRTKWPALPPYAPKLQALVDGVYQQPKIQEFLRSASP